MAQLRVRIGEGEKAQPNLLWDSVWSPWGGNADWAIADADETQNRGGLRAKAALHTAIVLALFTDKRLPDQHPFKKYVDDGDPRGWWGDTIDVRDDLGEAELGSILWVFARAPLTDAVILEARTAAQDALACLIAQGAAARVEVDAIAEKAFGRLDLIVNVYGRDGATTHSVRFDDIWKQTVAEPPPPFISKSADTTSLTADTTFTSADFAL